MTIDIVAPSVETGEFTWLAGGAVGGGLALFLYGMQKMTESLKTVAGDGMKKLLARLTTNRFTAAFAGAVVTAVEAILYDPAALPIAGVSLGEAVLEAIGK